jgi:hypothetical protein
VSLIPQLGDRASARPRGRLVGAQHEPFEGGRIVDRLQHR